MVKQSLFVALLAAVSMWVSAEEMRPPLAVEHTGVIETLPERYPADWFLVHDAAFFHMSDGKVVVIDTTKDSVGEQVQGMFPVSLMGTFIEAQSRGEILAIETFHTRGTRGDRIDVLTICDTVNLSAVGEVILPAGKRFMGMPERVALQLLKDDRWLAVFNLSPSTSVTLVDLDTRAVMGEIPIPGCSFIYANGDMGLSALCADGRMLTVVLNDDGSEKSRVMSEVFFDSDESPIFERPAVVDNIAYFPAFDGRVQPVAMTGSAALPMASWPLYSKGEEAWAPSGIGIDGEDDLGRIYFLMNAEANGVDGMHNAGGSEVWVFDPEARRRVLRIPLEAWGLSLAVSRGEEPKVLVTNPTDMSVELYDGLTGSFIKNITGFGQETPLLLRGAQ